MYEIYRQQNLNAPLDKVWEFIATPKNLNELTPPSLHFQILSELPPKMYNGLMIRYLIKIPLLGYQPWITEIKHIHEGFSFVDEQRKGPYKFWYHLHRLETVDNQTRVTDHVYYEMPFRRIGRLAHSLFVKATLNQIFDYRQQRLNEIFHLLNG